MSLRVVRSRLAADRGSRRRDQAQRARRAPGRFSMRVVSCVWLPLPSGWTVFWRSACVRGGCSPVTSNRLDESLEWVLSAPTAGLRALGANRAVTGVQPLSRHDDRGRRAGITIRAAAANHGADDKRRE